MSDFWDENPLAEDFCNDVLNDIDTKKWLPLHATTKKVGVISDRPFLIALDHLPGLSLGGKSSSSK